MKSMTSVSYLTAALLLGGASNALAADVACISFTVEGEWRFHPGVVNDLVVGYLAEHDGGPGYQVVWFERTTEGTYSMKGYEGENLLEGAAAIIDMYGEPNMFSYTEFADTSGASYGASFTPIVDGLAVTDPLQPHAGTLPSEVFDLLVQCGAQGAMTLSSLSSSEGEDCHVDSEMEETLDVFTAQTETLIATHGADGGEPIMAVLACCWPRTTRTSFQMPAGGWTSTNPTGTTCNYSRPMTVYTTTCNISITCAVTCTTAPSGVATQLRSCPGNASGNCPLVPSCQPN